MFEVYTYFGRVIARFYIGDELHHHALERARKKHDEYEISTGNKAWIRYIKES